jgi:High potential iron-sulfur protein
MTTPTSVPKPSMDRRHFVLHAASGGLALCGMAAANAQAAMVDESDPKAVSLGYKANAAKVDKAKQPKYAAGQLCSNCVLYQGAASAAAAPCPLFPGKQVAGKGWCNAWVKKA